MIGMDKTVMLKSSLGYSSVRGGSCRLAWVLCCTHRLAQWQGSGGCILPPSPQHPHPGEAGPSAPGTSSLGQQLVSGHSPKAPHAAAKPGWGVPTMHHCTGTKLPDPSSQVPVRCQSCCACSCTERHERKATAANSLGGCQNRAAFNREMAEVQLPQCLV